MTLPFYPQMACFRCLFPGQPAGYPSTPLPPFHTPSSRAAGLLTSLTRSSKGVGAVQLQHRPNKPIPPFAV